MPFIKKKTSTVQRDHVGLYVLAANHVARPAYGTVFEEGDEVKGHYHSIGNFMVGLPDMKPSDPNAIYELWVAQFISAHAYKVQNLSFDFLKKNEDASKFCRRNPDATFADFVKFDYESRLNFVSSTDYNRGTERNSRVAPTLRKFIRSGRLERFFANAEEGA